MHEIHLHDTVGTFNPNCVDCLAIAKPIQEKLNTVTIGLALIAVTTGELLRNRQISLQAANVYSDILNGIALSLSKLEKENGTD